MRYGETKKDVIFSKTDGQCHICRAGLERGNYGMVGKSGAWEVDHSNPRARGGTDGLNNLLAACVSCNRSKGKSSSRAARANHGHRAAPYSSDAKAENAMVWGIVGAVGGRVLLASLGPAGIAIGLGLGVLGSLSSQPD